MSLDKLLTSTEIRKKFIVVLSQLFQEEFPEYKQFLAIVNESNAAYIEKKGKENITDEDRVAQERHGAIRVATQEELKIIKDIFEVIGCFPVNFYDMTGLPKGALPIYATAFRPIGSDIEISPFRMFCSLLDLESVPEDVKEDVKEIIEKRKNLENTRFSPRLKELIIKYQENNGLNETDAKDFVQEAVNSLTIQKNRVVDFALYKKLREKNDLLADLVCVGINVNHLTPRVYDIEDVSERLQTAGLEMKAGGIEGPTIRDDAVPIQLNQTSIKAPNTNILVSANLDLIGKNSDRKAITLEMEVDETLKDYLERIQKQVDSNQDKVFSISHKSRFAEVESRGVALTEKGEELYNQAIKEGNFKDSFPKTHEELFAQKLAYYQCKVCVDKIKDALSTEFKIPENIAEMVKQGYVELCPQRYEDFLASSAAGIFKSNLSEVKNEEQNTSRLSDTAKNKDSLEKALGREIINPHDLYKQLQDKSEKSAIAKLGSLVSTFLAMSFCVPAIKPTIGVRTYY